MMTLSRKQRHARYRRDLKTVLDSAKAMERLDRDIAALTAKRAKQARVQRDALNRMHAYEVARAVDGH